MSHLRNGVAIVALTALVALSPGPRPAVAQAVGSITEIDVSGNNRIEQDTVKAYLTLIEGDRYSATEADRSLKTLFATGLFSDVSIRFEQGRLVVDLVENPMISRIAFEGNRRTTDEELSTEIKLRPRVVYTRTKVQSDVQRVLELYRRQGRFAATVVPKVIKRPQNRVDLVFEINEGASTGVRELVFVGNDFFDDGDLKDVINTTESAWWRFLSVSDNYDPDRITFDRELLRRHYLRSGFPDFRVLSAVAELTADRSDFFITYTVEEGARYRFGDVALNSLLEDVDLSPLEVIVDEALENEEWFNNEVVDDIVDRVTENVNNQGYAFVDVRPRIRRDRETNLVNIDLEIQEGPKVFVQRIDIEGNVRTLDEVIRREFQLVEGDPFNAAKLRSSRIRLEDLDFFQKVDVQQIGGDAPDQTVIQVEVEEKSTGEFTVGGGFGSDSGVFGVVSMRERNLLGKGQNLRVSTNIGQAAQRIDLSFTEPYFLDRKVAAGFDLFRTETDRQDTSSFDEERTGFALRASYDIAQYLSQSVKYTVSRNEITNVQSDAARSIREEEGLHTLSSVSQTLAYDRRDRRTNSTKGYVLLMTNELAGLGGSEKWMRNGVSGTHYWPVFRETVVSARMGLSHIFGYAGGDVSISDRFSLGGAELRGFESAGAGPRDITSNDSLGGNLKVNGGVEMTFPISGLPDALSLTGKVFSDFGTLTGLDGVPSSEVYDTGSLRAAAGVGLSWDSPFGPLGVDFALPYLSESHDETESIRLSFGTRF